jgi:hypothetical protein
MRCFKSLAFEEFHRDECSAVLLADVVNRADIGMVQCGRGSGFSAEAFQGLAVFAELAGKKFKGNKAIEAGVLGFVDHTHPAPTEFFENAIVGDGAADKRLELRHLALMVGSDLRQVNGHESTRTDDTLEGVVSFRVSPAYSTAP